MFTKPPLSVESRSESPRLRLGPSPAVDHPPVWHPVDYFLTGLWLSIPSGLFASQRLLIPLFNDASVTLPVVAPHLLHQHAPLLLLIVALAVLITLLIVPGGSSRRLCRWTACLSGILIASLYVYALAVPLVQLLNEQLS